MIDEENIQSQSARAVLKQ